MPYDLFIEKYANKLANKFNILQLYIKYIFFGPPKYFLYFCHIPKTCGTSIYTMCSNYYIPSRCFFGKLHVREYVNSFANLNNYDFVSGHLDFGYYIKSIIDRPVKEFTFIREPKAHLISLYNHICSNENHHLHDLAKSFDFSIDQFFKNSIIANYCENFQSNYLSIFEKSSPINNVKPIDLPPRNCYEAAENRLSEFSFVGICELFNESVYRLFRHLSFKPPAFQLLLNQSDKKIQVSSLSSQTRFLIEDLTSVDQKLYKLALNKFHSNTKSFFLPGSNSLLNSNIFLKAA